MTTLTPIEEVVQRAKVAAQFLGNPSAWTPNAAPTIAEYQAHLMDAIRELEAATGRVRQLEQDASLRERSHALSMAARDSDHREASAEIIRLRDSYSNLLRSKDSLQKALQEQLPSDDEVGEMLLDVREAVEWLYSAAGGSAGLIRPADLSKVAALFARLESFVRTTEVERRKAMRDKEPGEVDLAGLAESVRNLRDNTPGPAEAIDALAGAVALLTRVVDRDQRARLRREVGR